MYLENVNSGLLLQAFIQTILLYSVKMTIFCNYKYVGIDKWAIKLSYYHYFLMTNQSVTLLSTYTVNLMFIKFPKSRLQAYR